MKIFMTRHTNRLNVKSMFFGVPFVVVVLSSSLATFTQQGIDFSQLALKNSSLYGISGIYFFWVIGLLVIGMAKCPSFPRSCLSGLTFFALFTSFTRCFIFIGFSITYYAFLTPRAKSVPPRFVSVKLRNWLNFLALGTRFCYDLLRHGFFLIKRLCLEPLQTQYLCGLFYYNILNNKSQAIFRDIL